ncbi:MAG: hypothetical protein IJJ33_12085 [Victivallales bacterium]|nr:hypothetical protein [Victivallales bacterium]
MKSNRAFRRLLPVLVALAALAQGSQDFHEIHLSESEPVSHLGDIDFFANPKFTPPPATMTEKAFLKEPLVDFATNLAWTARLFHCEGFLCLSRDQSIRNRPNLKLELTNSCPDSQAELRPERPLQAMHDFDTFMLLAYAKNLTAVTVRFRMPNGTPFTWKSRNDDFNEVLTGWNLLRIPLKTTLPAGTLVESIGFATVPFRANRPPDIWHLEQFDVAMGADHLKRPPVEFHPGPIVRIPVSPEGARPVSREPVTTRVWQEGDSFRLGYANAEGDSVTYVYRPRTGTLEDIAVSCGSDAEFRPAVGGGPMFEAEGKEFDCRTPGQVAAAPLSVKLEVNRVSAIWQYRFGDAVQVIRWQLTIREKSLVVDLDSRECFLKEWRPGYADGMAAEAKVFDVPFMNHSPRIVWNDGWFLSHFLDHYKGNFSMHAHEAGNQVVDGKAFYHFLQGGYYYVPRSDGSRHPLRETVYLTVARKFEEVLLNPSNPQSPHQGIMSDNLYKKFEVRAEIFAKAKELTDLYDQYGVNHIFFDVFSFVWMSGVWGSPESSFHADKTSYIHQKNGGDQGLREMLADVQRKGMVPGVYETYNAMQVKSSQWDPAKVAISPEGHWRYANVQAYMHKMWALPDWEQGFFRERNQRFQPRQTGYVDGFTSRLPFMYNDYDHRYPEAGKMIDTIRAIGTGFQRIRENYQGPVFAEGRGADYYWAGLNDGDYGKLPGFGHRLKPRQARYPLLVDFRLKKLNPLAPAWGLNIGYSLFCGNPSFMTDDYSLLYHYLAMNIAFGTVGFIEPCGDAYPDPHTHFDKTLETYYLVRQLQKRYLMQQVKAIRYFDGDRLVSTEEALVSGKYRDNMLYVEYANGLEIYINCNWEDRVWEITVDGQQVLLPGGGWFARQGNDFLEYSALRNGSRVSFVDSPEYRYLNGYGQKVDVGGCVSDRILIQCKSGRRAGETLLYPPLQPLPSPAPDSRTQPPAP